MTLILCPKNFKAVIHRVRVASDASVTLCVCVCSGPRCVARFDFEGEHSDELSFTEGQVIRLVEYVGEEWARGGIGSHVGLFPLNFVEVMEDLPPSPAKNQTRVPLPGTDASSPCSVQPVSFIPTPTTLLNPGFRLVNFTGLILTTELLLLL